MTPDLDAAFAWYCDFLAAQGMDVPSSIHELSHTRLTILRTTAELQAARANATTPIPHRARVVTVQRYTGQPFGSVEPRPTLRERLATRNAGV